MIAIRGGSLLPIPDRIERTIDLAQPPQRVWDALTSAEGLGSWFGDRYLWRGVPALT